MELKCFGEWGQLPQSGDTLFSQAEKSSLFFSRHWFENLALTGLKNDERMLLVCVVEKSQTKIEEQDKVLAILPLITRHNKKWTSLHHIYTSLYTLLLANDNQQEIIHCLAKGLTQLPFDSLELDPVADDDSNLNHLRYAMESSGFSCMRYARFFNWFHPLHDHTFSDYMGARLSRIRNTIARKQRKLEREQGYEIKLYTGSDVQKAMKDFDMVYAASWKAKEQHSDVMEGFIGRFSKLDWTRLAILYIKSEPVAAQIWFVVHKKASIFKLAYDENWKQYSLGSILTQYLMERVINTDKVEEIDFLTGNDRYKQEWVSGRRQRWRIVFTRKSEPVKSSHSFIEMINSWLS